LVWKWTAEGGIDTPSLSKNGKYLIVPIIHDYITHKKDTSGVYVFDLEQKGGATSKLSIHYLTEGIPVAVDLSQDGKYIAFIEAPIDIDISEKEKIIGKHQLHLLI
ncbi:MAG: dehydrogenase, partial [Methanosarcinales archaeon]